MSVSHLVHGPKSFRKRSLLITAGLMVLVGGAYLVSTFASDNALIGDVIEGEYIHAVEEDFENNRDTEVFKVKDAAGNYWQLDVTGRKPEIKTGAKVRVAGTHKRSDLRHLAVARSEDLTVVGQAVTTPTMTPSSTAIPTTEVPSVLAARASKVAAIIVNIVITDGSTALKLGTPLMTQAQATAKYTTNTNSVRNYYLQSTENQMDVATTPIGPVNIQVSGLNATTCAYDQWADLADAAATAAGVNLTAYTSTQYSLPIVDSTLCNWAGLGYYNGKRSWIRDTGGATASDPAKSGVAAHELGHNLGMYHSNSTKCTDATGLLVAYGGTCTTVSYGDPFDTMGSQPPTRLLSALHRSILTMLPSKSVATATASGTYTLSSANVATATAGVQSLRFAAGAATLELEYRNPSGVFDNFATTDPAVNGVTIRSLLAAPGSAAGDSQLIDMMPASTTTTDAPLLKGTFYDPASKTSVTVMSRTATTITVKLALAGSAVAPVTPTITSISPTSFYKGQIVTITGSGFAANTGTAPLVGGAVPGHFAILSDTSIQFVAPAQATSSVPIGVATSWGSRSATINAAYTTAPPITVSGRITNSVSGAGIGGISVQKVCLSSGAGAAVTTAADGTYSFSVLPGDQYCVWPNKNLPTGSVVHPTSNRPEHPTWVYYWYQQAGLNAYQSPMYVGDSAYTSDLASDSGLDFKVDVPGTVTPTPTPSPKIGDLTGDGLVNVFDLSKLLADWNKTSSAADFNHDAKVNVFDLSILLSNWTP